MTLTGGGKHWAYLYTGVVCTCTDPAYRVLCRQKAAAVQADENSPMTVVLMNV